MVQPRERVHVAVERVRVEPDLGPLGQSLRMCKCIRPGLATMIDMTRTPAEPRSKVLIVVGDASETLDTRYPCGTHSVRNWNGCEGNWEPVNKSSTAPLL